MTEFIAKYWVQIFFVAILGYLLGSINFSIIVTRRIKKELDIRDMGSGNAGFTNVLRSVGKVPAIITFAGDISKSALSIFLGRLIFVHFVSTDLPIFYVYQFGAYVAGISCVIGHIYPCFFKFKGGKGVLTIFVMVFFIDFRVFLIMFAVWGIMLLLTKIMSLSSIVAAVFYPVATFAVGYFFDCSQDGRNHSMEYIVMTTILSFIMSVLVICKHKSNIKRLIKGEERKISMKKKNKKDV